MQHRGLWDGNNLSGICVYSPWRLSVCCKETQELMDDISPPVAVTLELNNSVCDVSETSNHVDKLVTDAVSFGSDPSDMVASELYFNGCGSFSGVRSEMDAIDMLAPRESCTGGTRRSNTEPENGNVPVEIDVIVQGSEEDEILVVDDNNNVAGTEILPVAVEIENIGNCQIVAKAIILEEPTIDSGPSGEIHIAAVGPDAEISSNPDLKEVVLQSAEEKNVSKGCGRTVFELECIPLWGTVSICGKRPEMEDAIAVVPRGVKVPIKLLIGDRVIDGVSQSLTHLTAHFFGVYDGHGGAQVADYCRDRMRRALVEEISIMDNNLANGSSGDNRQMQWAEVFTSCFLKVDDEIAGKVDRGVTEDNGALGDVALEPIAPETVGSTAVVALVCSSHIIVANCGDSRAVLCRGKEPVALSVDHKPNREDEYARIEAAGGRIIQWNGHRVFGVLAMSRSIGDRYLKPWIIPEPEVMFVPRAREDDCLIIASDGLWDVMTNEEACEAARKRILIWHKKNGPIPLVERGKGIDAASQAAADYLSTLAIQRGSKDNISVIVVDLKAQRKFKTKS